MTKNEFKTMFEVLDRVCELSDWIKMDRIGFMMDLEFANDEIPLDFKKLLNFDRFDFWHDISGIYNNFNRQTKKMDNCFLPRCAK